MAAGRKKHPRMSSTEDAALRRRIRDVSRALERMLGKPKQPPRTPTPLEMLIATILSQNTNDKNSHRAYRSLRTRFPTWKGTATARRSNIVATIRSGGMANQKAQQIQDALAMVKRRYGRYSLESIRKRTTNTILRELTEINGVGVKTAACVLLFSLKRDVFPVDTHVHRICTRLALAPNAKTPAETFQQMKGLIPRGRGYSFHTNLIRFGRRICRSHRPYCGSCPFYRRCSFVGKSERTTATFNERGTNHDFMILDNVAGAG